MEKVDIDDLASTVKYYLSQFAEVTNENMEFAVKETAVHLVEDLKQDIPTKFNGTKYANSWAYKKQKTKKYHYNTVVYSKSPYYRLTHLLENGHATVSGGRVEGKPHISIVEAQAFNYLMDYLKAGIESGR